MYFDIITLGGFIMGEKDIIEKILESYNDVFADIVNVLLFKGNVLYRKML